MYDVILCVNISHNLLIISDCEYSECLHVIVEPSTGYASKLRISYIFQNLLVFCYTRNFKKEIGINITIKENK